MAGFEVITYGRFWVITEADQPRVSQEMGEIILGHSELRISPRRESFGLRT
jgi:hypothetical protein